MNTDSGPRRDADAAGTSESGAADGPWTLHESARWTGGAVWRADRLHQILGGWAATAAADQPASWTVFFSEVARHHAWQATQLSALLPVLRELPADTLVQPPDPADAAVLTDLDEVAAGRRLDAWCVHATAWHDELTRRRGNVADHVDRSLARTLGFVLMDLDADMARANGHLPAGS